MKKVLVFLCMAVVFTLSATAQTPPPPAPNAPAATQAQAPAPETAKQAENKDVPAAEAAAPKAEGPKGDVIKLKSGSVLKNVQVVRRSPSELEVEVSPGVITTIPRKLIEKVEYDDYEPSSTRAKASETNAATAQSDLILGDKIKPELSEKLAAPIPEPALKFDNQDLTVVLDEISKRAQVPITVDDSIRALPEDQRKLSFESKPGTNLSTVLREDLVGKLKNVDVLFQYDHIVIITKDAVAKNAATATPPQAPAPPALAPESK